jgi:hypothetical protein
MKLPEQVAMVCPMCCAPADLQGTGYNKSATHHRFLLYCHTCHASVIMDVCRNPPKLEELHSKDKSC